MVQSFGKGGGTVGGGGTGGKGGEGQGGRNSNFEF